MSDKTDMTAAPDERKITMTYRNWRGEISRRTIQPWGVRFDATDWHPEPQWLLEAWDFDKQAVRDFALADCQFADLNAVVAGDLVPAGRPAYVAGGNGAAVRGW